MSNINCRNTFKKFFETLRGLTFSINISLLKQVILKKYFKFSKNYPQ